jgi:hypothetical protein
MNFDEYLDNLKQESERGAVPNDEIPIERFIQVADNIISKIVQSMPKQSTFIRVCSSSKIGFRLKERIVRTVTTIHASESLCCPFYKSDLESSSSFVVCLIISICKVLY